MDSIKRSETVGRTGLEVAVLLGYDPEQVAGVIVEDEVRVGIWESVDGERVIATQYHPIVEG